MTVGRQQMGNHLTHRKRGLVASEEVHCAPQRRESAAGTQAGSAAPIGARGRAINRQMMGFLTAQSGAVQEAEALKARVKSLEEEGPLRKLDPSTIRPSKWANRHAASFLTVDFEELKAEIAAAGGNVQPIKVRPVSVLNRSTRPSEDGRALLGAATELDQIANQHRTRRKPGADAQASPNSPPGPRTGPNLVEIALAKYHGRDHNKKVD